jgi:hypothetical protein
MNKTHAIFFDGTSYFVDAVDAEVDFDTVAVFKSTDLGLCNSKCDELNEKI